MDEKRSEELSRRGFLAGASAVVAAAATVTGVRSARGEPPKAKFQATADPFLTLQTGVVGEGSKVVFDRAEPPLFVHRVSIRRKSDFGRITADFRFQDVAEGHPPVELTLLLEDAQGGVFHSTQRWCEDLRTKPPKIRESGPKSVDMQPRQNHEEFEITFDHLDLLAGLTLEFRHIQS